jgi:hypothetical protein
MSGSSSQLVNVVIAGIPTPYVDNGVVNNYLINIPGQGQPGNLQVFFFLARNSSTGNCTLKINNLTPIPVGNSDYSQLYVGQILANQLIGVIYFNTIFVIIYGSSQQTQQNQSYINSIAQTVVAELPFDIPTTKPAISGQLWNNDGTLSIS